MNNPLGTSKWVPIANHLSVSAITPHKKWVPPSSTGYLQELGCWRSQVCTELPNIFPSPGAKTKKAKREIKKQGMLKNGQVRCYRLSTYCLKLYLLL